jgi:D-amino peptidase
MKVYILTDIEGVAGVANFEDYSYETGRFYPLSRHLLTLEVNAAVDGALEAGASEVVVWDGHGPGAINVEELHAEAKLLHGTGVPRTLGLERGFDALFFVGQHAMSRAERAGLAHSYSSRNIEHVFLNGARIGEFGMRVILAGCFDIPVVLVTGDTAMRDEAVQYIPNIEAVVVKESLNISSAITLSPVKARELIRAGAKRSLERRGEIAPYRMSGPFDLRIQFKAVEHAERRATMPGWTRLDAFTTQRTTDNFLDLAW